MTLSLKTSAFVFVIFLLLFITPARSDDGYTLRYSTEPAQRDFTSETRATINLHIDDFPLPGAYVDVRNIEIHSLDNRWERIVSYDKNNDCITMKYGGTPVWTRLGYDFFQLPPTSELLEAIKEMSPKRDQFELIPLDSNQEITLKITPRGKLLGVDIEFPKEVERQVSMFMPIVINTISNMVDPPLPEKPVKVGESWQQKVKLDTIPKIKLPPLFINYTLMAVEKDDNGDLVGRIAFDLKWHYNLDLTSEIIKEHRNIQYWDNKELEIVKFIPSVDVKMDGSFKFNITKGFTSWRDSDSEMRFSADMALKKTSGHAKGEIWSPHADYFVVFHELATMP